MRNLLVAVDRNTYLDKTGGLMARVEGKVEEAGSTKSRLARLLQSAGESDAMPDLSSPAAVVSNQFEGLHVLVTAPETGSAPIEQLITMLSELYGQIDAMSAGMGDDLLQGATPPNWTRPSRAGA